MQVVEKRSVKLGTLAVALGKALRHGAAQYAVGRPLDDGDKLRGFDALLFSATVFRFKVNALLERLEDVAKRHETARFEVAKPFALGAREAPLPVRRALANDKAPVAKRLLRPERIVFFECVDRGKKRVARKRKL